MEEVNCSLTKLLTVSWELQIISLVSGNNVLEVTHNLFLFQLCLAFHICLIKGRWQISIWSMKQLTVSLSENYPKQLPFTGISKREVKFQVIFSSTLTIIGDKNFSHPTDALAIIKVMYKTQHIHVQNTWILTLLELHLFLCTEIVLDVTNFFQKYFNLFQMQHV